MIDEIIHWLSKKENQDLLKLGFMFIGTLATLVGALWAIYKFWYLNIWKQRKERAEAEHKKVSYVGLQGLLPPFITPFAWVD